MEQNDHDLKSNAISDDEELLMREVIQGDAELCYLHHYLTELYRSTEI